MTLYSGKNNPASGEERFNFILRKLDKVSVNDHCAKACCPAHDDAEPSLEVKLHSDDKISVKCHKGCDYTSILSSIDVQPAFLYPPQKQLYSKSSQKVDKSGRRIVKIYTYRQLNGHHAYEVVRYEPKDFRMRVDEKNWSMRGVSRIPYNLPEMAKSIQQNKPILFVEGEKDADNGMQLGLTTTTVPNGCGKWRDEYAQYFQGADLVFIPHNDDVGRTGALRIAVKLRKIAKRIRFLTLPMKNLKEDLSDWIKQGGDLETLRNMIFLEGVFLDEMLLIHQLNKKHAVIMMQGKLAVMNEEFNPTFKRDSITFSTTQHFADRYINKSHLRSAWKKDSKEDNLKKQSEGKAKSNISYSIQKEMQPQGKIWLQSAGRRQYDGFFFNPEGPLEENRMYNFWRGFHIKPKKGDWSLFKNHIWQVLANQNEEIYKYIVNWMADAIQNRAKRPGVSIIMRGGQGTGKGTFANILGHLYGRHFVPVADAKHIVGAFNAHLKDCLLLFGDEAFNARDKRHESILKNLVTDPTRPVEFKGKDVDVLPNYTRLIMASNKSWVVPVDMDDRRFFILDVSSKWAKNEQYFSELYAQMENGGYEALLYDLQHLDISQASIRNFPITTAILDNKLASLDTIGQWIYEGLLSDDFIPSDGIKNIAALYNEYKEFCGNLRPTARNGWSREVKKFFPHFKITRQYAANGRDYEVGSLEQCREAFERRLQTKIDWETVEE